MRQLVTLALLSACVLVTTAQAFTCTPIRSGCVCKTIDSLSCGDLNQMKNAIIGKMNSLSGESRVRFKGGVVRLVFHDAAEFRFGAAAFADGSPPYRSDGCIDLAFSGNAGLDVTVNNLDGLWAQFCNKISRADFWYFAAKVVIEASTPYVTPGDPAHQVSNWMLPFFTGRIDRTSCPTIGTSNLPDGEGGPNEIRRSLITNLGLDVQHSVALLGAHCLGGASASGYVGHWTMDPDKFTTHFFQSLLLWGFIKTARPGGLQQYSIDQSTSSTPALTTTVFMLNTDMALLYDIDHQRDRGNSPTECGPPPPRTPVKSCAFTKNNVPSLNFEQWVRTFADDSGAVTDAPGASPFIFAFARALTYIGQVGYAEGELKCMQCTSSICTDPSCNTASVQCGLNNRFVGHPPPPATSGPTPAPTTTTSAPSPTSTPTPSGTSSSPNEVTDSPSGFQCTACTSAEKANFCNMCSANAFVCTAGSAVGGCGGADSWGHSSSCTKCCACGSTAAPTPAPTTTAAPTPAPTTTPAPTAAPPTTTPAPTPAPTAAPTSAPTSSAPNEVTTAAPAAFTCTTCSASQEANYCSKCSSSSFVCTAGSAVGGCRGDSWGQFPDSCSACCVCSGNAGSASSSPNEVTTAAPPTSSPTPTTTSPPAPTPAPTTPYSSSSPNEVTTAAPPTPAPTPYTSPPMTWAPGTTSPSSANWGLWTAGIVAVMTAVVVRWQP